MPMARPRIDDVLAGIRFAIDTDFEPPGGADAEECRDDAGCAPPLRFQAVGKV